MSQHVVRDDSKRVAALGIRVVKANVVSETEVVRHDPIKLASVLMQLIAEIREAQEPKPTVRRFVCRMFRRREHIRS